MSSKTENTHIEHVAVEIGKKVHASRCVIIGPGAGANLVEAQDKFLLGVGDVTILEIDMAGKSVVFRDKDGGTLLRAEWFASGTPQVTFSENPDLMKRNSYNDILDAFRMFVEAMESGREGGRKDNYCPHRDDKCDPKCSEWPEAHCPDGPPVPEAVVSFTKLAIERGEVPAGPCPECGSATWSVFVSGLGNSFRCRECGAELEAARKEK